MNHSTELTILQQALDTLAKGGDIEGEAERVRKQVNELCARHPVYRTAALGAA